MSCDLIVNWYPGMRVRVLRNRYGCYSTLGTFLVPGDTVEVLHVDADAHGEAWVTYDLGRGSTNRIAAADVEPVREDPLAFTVTVAGPERHQLDKPFVWVLHATDALVAAERAMAHHRSAQETDDVVLVSVVPGVPRANCGYAWNDLR
jgi:hypothetical protein